MTKSILVALCGALTLGVASGCANDLRDDTNETGRSNLESEGERESDDERESGEEAAGEEAVSEEAAGEEAVGEEDDGRDSDAATGFYRASWCGVQPLIETEAISRDEALANCQLNALYNPEIDLYCTWNDEVLFDGCEEGDGSDNAAATSIYRGYFCGEQLFGVAFPT